jgi:hypothetical protein
MTQPTPRIIQLTEHIARIGDFDVAINRRTKKLDVSRKKRFTRVAK